MKNQLFLCILALGLLSACSKENSPIDHVILDESLSKAYTTLTESNKQERSQILFENGSSANNCNSYTKLIENHIISDSSDNHLIKSEYLVCDALRILSGSQKFSGEINTDLIGTNLLNKLDLRSFPNSVSQLTDAESFTLAKLFPNASNASGSTVTLDTEDLALTISVVAIVQANNDTMGDWVVHVADESKSGTYRDYRTLIIYNPDKGDTIEATPYPSGANQIN